MKYLTKEWYETLQWSNHAPEVDERAAEFSEEFFQELYEQELGEILTYRFEGAAIDEYNRQHPDVNVLDEAEFKRYSREVDAWMSTLDPEKCEFFDAEKEQAVFDRVHQQKMDTLRKYLPPEIMAKVADLRVLALDVGTQELRDYFAERYAWTKQVSKASYQSDKVYIERHPGSFAKDFHLHDARLLEMRWEGKDMLWSMENGPFWNVEVRFCDCEVVQMDEMPKYAWWLYEEFYEAGDKCEMHALLVGRDEDSVRSEPLEMVIRVLDVRIVWKEREEQACDG